MKWPSETSSIMQEGTITPGELQALAREVFEASGLTQQQLAERLEVAQPSVAQALGSRAGLDSLRRRIIAEVTDYEVEGPHYSVRHK